MYGSYSYEYHVEFFERKSFVLEVLPNLRIIVKAPLQSTLDEIESFLIRKWSWLERQLTDLRMMQKTRHQRQYIAGESYYYLGRQYMLLVEKGDDIVKMLRGKIVIYTTSSLRNSVHNQKLLERWYAKNRDRVFKQEYIRAYQLFDYEVLPPLRQRSMQRRWGSYTTDRKVLLNPRLIEAPREAIFYVCVHELCHVVNRRHDKAFYDDMTRKMPNWREVKRLLEVRFG